MKRIDLYIQEVTRKLPEKMREDIALELRSTIEDMLPDNYSEDDVKQELEKLGDPAALAAQYKDQPMHLIGPKFYDIYKTILKIVILAASFGSLLALLIRKIETLTGDETFPIMIVLILGEGLWVVIGAIIQSFFWVTIIFIILERTIAPTIHTPLTWSGKKWTPSDLDKLSYLPHYKAIKKSEIIFSFLWIVIWSTLYFNATRLIGVYESGKEQALQFKLPVFDRDILMSYWPIVVFFIIFELVLTVYKAISRKWTYQLAISNSIVQLLGAVFLIIIVINPNVLNPDFVTYMAETFGNTLESTHLLMTRITWGVVFAIIVISTVDIITSFLKARA